MKNGRISLAYQFNQGKKRELKKADKWPKIYLLIFFASFFDFNEFIIFTTNIPIVTALSSTTILRFCSLLTVTSTIICYSTLRFKIGKHQIFSVISIGICLIVIIILELIYKPKDINIREFFISYLIIFLHFIFLSFTDNIERYLSDYDFLNPLLVLMTEGIFGFLMTLLFAFFQDPFKEINIIYKRVETWQFIILIFLLILYWIFSAGINVYKIYCNVFYSPMTKSLATYFLNSVFILYHYIDGDAFVVEGKRNFLYFFANLILVILIEFLGLIFNEIFILNFCGLRKDIHVGIAIRARKQEMSILKNKMDYEDADYFIKHEPSIDYRKNSYSSYNSKITYNSESFYNSN